MKRSESSTRLVAWLAEHGLSHAAFAADVSANRSQIYRLCTGERGPAIPLAQRIEDATGGVVKASGWARERRRTKKAARRTVGRRAGSRAGHDRSMPSHSHPE